MAFKDNNNKPIDTLNLETKVWCVCCYVYCRYTQYNYRLI
jgi:hypothetical protein